MYVNKWTVFVGFVFLIFMECRVGAWTRQWAVHIEGGESVASDVARDHGFDYNGKIFDDWYHFQHRSVSKRSTEPHLEVQHRLNTDSRVKRAHQQRLKSRKKRDLIVKKAPKERIYLNDDRWSLMWYLNRGNGLDMNVQGAWAEGITGRDVVVTILDDGLEKDHPDLYLNYDPQASYDVNSHDNDPMPRYDLSDSNRHGTRCAGEVAATANNSICAVGVAYGAGVGGVRMLDGDVTDAVEARSLSLNSQHIDIYSASWGPDDDGKTVDGPGELATRAFIEGVTKGRNGKGSIFVWASGNGGREFDDCNCDGYTNSIWTLSISSATENGLVPWYSEACSSTLATTYSSGSGHEKQVVTTDLHHRCTSSHTGTSASAPLAAGICALALEANKELTWRDMQHIVVRTAKPANLKAPDWVTNGVGRNVSHSFGYGLMDATAMVRLAKDWRTVPEQRKCEVSSSYTNRGIPSRSHLDLELHVKECSGVNFLEHVQAKISLMASRRGDLMITLTSPQGTKSTLLAKRSHDISKAGFHQWPFMSVHTWGERPHGTWKLVIHNEGRYLGRATLHEWALIFYGTATVPDRSEYALYSPANINSSKNRFSKLRDSNNSIKNSLNTYGIKGKLNNNKLNNKYSQSYITNLQQQLQTPTNNNNNNNNNKKQKLRGQHKNGKSTNRLITKPTVQTERGLTTGRGTVMTLKPRVRSTPKPIKTSTVTIIKTTTPAVKKKIKPTKKNFKQLSTSILTTTTVAPLQKGLILMEPAVKTVSNNNNNNNKVPVVFQQYPKIQQLYPLYPVYAGARGVDQHSARVKGLDLLQDQQFETRNLQLTDKDTLNEWQLVFYGTETSLEIDDDLDKDKSGSLPPDIDQNINSDVHQNVVDTEGDPLLGSQKVDLISHPESQRPTTENHTSGSCIVFNSNRCLECKKEWYLYEGRCLSKCPLNSYAAKSQDKSVCTMCHYSCLSCSGPSDVECKSCHDDATLLSLNSEEFQCILKSLEWTSKSTKWFYRMSVLVGLNLIIFLLISIYFIILSCNKYKNNNEGYVEVSLNNKDDENVLIVSDKNDDRQLESD